MTWRWLLATIVIIAGIAAYGFRWRTEDHPYWGTVRRIWRWGRAAEMRIDRNHDGTADLRLVYERFSTEFDNNPPDAYWEDRNFDGRYDLHAVYAGVMVQTIRMDDDHDGVYERELHGEAARQYRQNHPPRVFLRKNGRKPQ